MIKIGDKVKVVKMYSGYDVILPIGSITTVRFIGERWYITGSNEWGADIFEVDHPLFPYPIQYHQCCFKKLGPDRENVIMELP